MALHMIRSTPNFTRSMRGYDVEEVDEYVDALRESEDEQAEAMASLEAANSDLNAEIERLRGRIAELETCIRSETPRSIAALGERLTLVLEEAEAGANEAVRSAREEADTLLASAQASAEEQRLLSAARTADAEQRATARISNAEETARNLEASARLRAEDIVNNAEARALARRQEIEAWVERVRAHIEGEEARAAEEFARVRGLRNAELAALGRRREAMFTSMQEMAESLRAIVATATATTDRAADSMPELSAGTASPEAPADPAAGDERNDGDANVDASGDADAEAHADAHPEVEETGGQSPIAGAAPGPILTGRVIASVDEEPSEAEESAMVAFFGPEAATARRPGGSAGGDDDTASIPAATHVPFDGEADAAASETDDATAASFYSEHRGR